MYYEKEGPNVQSQEEHSAYKKMKNIQANKFSSKEDKLKAENQWLKSKMKKQAREIGGWYED